MAQWTAYSPILNYFDADEVFKDSKTLSDNISIENMPDWVANHEILQELSSNDRLDFTATGKSICVQYEADNLGDPVGLDISREISKHELAGENILMTPLAFWITKQSSFSSGPILHFEHHNDTPTFRSLVIGARTVTYDDYKDAVLVDDDITKAGKYLVSMLSLDRKGTIRTAIRLVHNSITEKMWEVRYMLQWIALESLFGPSDPQELSYRISQRIGFFLGTNRDEARDYYIKAKKGYGWRSKISHGLKTSKLKDDQTSELGLDTELLLIESLKKILSDRKLIEMIDSDKREEFLDNLIFYP